MKQTYTDARKKKKILDKLIKTGRVKFTPSQVIPQHIVDQRPKGLFLDDERKPSEVTWAGYSPEKYNWTIVRTPDEFRKAIKEKIYDVYSFDNYLGYCSAEHHGENKITGETLLVELCEVFKQNKPEDMPRMFFHTQQQATDSGFRFKSIEMERLWFKLSDEIWS